MKYMLEKNNLIIKPPKLGEIIQGKIIAKEKGAVYLDLGLIGTGIIYGKEFNQAREILKNLNIGDTIFAKIIDLENEHGYIELSVSEAGKEITWKELKQKKEKGEFLKIKVLGANKGGLLTEISGIPAFLPVSQLSTNHYPKVEDGDTTKILKELQKFVGKELEVQIFDLDPENNKLILSEKLKETQKIKEMLKNYKVGDVVEVEVVAVVDFGAFVKFPAGNDNSEYLEGLIHISELDWKIIDNPAQYVKIGDKLKAKIVNIAGEKVFLSLKSLKEDPWKDINKTLKKGDIVEGTVVKLNPFGAFVEVLPQVQGLCHVSDFGSYEKMVEELKINKKYNFKILEIKPEEHRMILSLIKK